ncbi:hypothetical protein BBAD15_g9373 [Beauveria bassiana D1-5]|uniref:G-protein coupled receptors family 2 profile 2 domain-containing protein n=1 Tax=Beauveria bassiana D1-5 TaxID=1245745 RepID=A0A0A2VGV7_BEABA|nr:hypothetical protein BBAD15_g9373 [Beauveria bassiana D1-5]
MDHNPAMDAIVNDGSDLSADQIATLVAIERTGASLSMIAIALIAASYLVYPKLRTTPNTFLLFASIANVGASIASMIGYDGLLQGEESSLCQGQAFIFEWFMQAEPWWSCAMACNVFLVFFCNVDPAMFTRYIWAYCVVCFGGPLIPAIALISIKDRSRGPVFGDATTTDVDDSAEEFRPARTGCYGIAVTEVHVETDLSPCDDQGHLIQQSPTHVATVSSSAAHVIETTHTLHTMDSIARTSVSVAQRSNKSSFSQQITRLKETATSRLRRLDPVKMAYLRTSFIFGFTVLVTWIPSSVNRVYSIANDGHINFTLSAVSGTVLPLQGVMNALIYFTTSWNTVRNIFKREEETIFGQRGTQYCNRRPARARFGAALGGRSSNIGQEDRRQSMRLEEIEMQVRQPDSTRFDSGKR